MVISELYLNQFYKIKISESFKLKLEDAKKTKQNLLIEISATHLGMYNKNHVIYNHSTVKDCIDSFVYPSPKPIIEGHKDPKKTEHFGQIIAAENINTKYYDILAKDNKLEGLSTKEYLELCKEVIIPYQKKHANYNGLSYVQLIGDVSNSKAIKKIQDSEYLYVSIGAKPKKLICSECEQDQTKKICDHYFQKGKNGIFMLAESLEYEELSFVDKPADKFGKITYIHDGKEEEINLEDIELDTDLDIIYAKDFFKKAEGKKIVCMDNICRVLNNTEETMRKKQDQKILNISYLDEFSKDQLKDIKITDEEEQNIEEFLKLTDEIVGELTNKDFAIVQKTEDGIKRRFPVNSLENTKAAIQLFDKAEDLTEAEKDKAISSITKAAKKYNLEFKIEDSAQENEEEKNKGIPTEDTFNLDSSISTLKDFIEKVEFEETEDGIITLKDYGPISSEEKKDNPISRIFDMLSSLAYNIKWAGESLQNSMDWYLKEKGKEAIEKSTLDSIQSENQSLKDSVAEKDEEILALEDQNMELNYTMRSSLVDEILEYKTSLKLVDGEQEIEKKDLMKVPYDQLLKQRKEFKTLALKLSDNTTLNNNTSITTIQNPVEDITNPTHLEDSIQEETKEVDTEKLFKTLFSRVDLREFENLFKKNKK